MGALFRVATFVNDEALYAEMRASFEGAGFVEPDAVYTVEQGEPYEAITRLGTADEPYVILVHQDVRCDQGYTATDLRDRLVELTGIDPTWSVAGNAGGLPDLRLVRHIRDPIEETWHSGELPVRVVTLDENFLVLRTERKPRCSTDLSGFHLYGSDVCLNAAADGSAAYVIDFRLTHLSMGNVTGLAESAEAFAERWSTLRPRYLRTPSLLVARSKSRFVRRVMNHPRVHRHFRR